jgi:hypothetical protein
MCMMVDERRDTLTHRMRIAPMNIHGTHRVFRDLCVSGRDVTLVYGSTGDFAILGDSRVETKRGL